MSKKIIISSSIRKQLIDFFESQSRLKNINLYVHSSELADRLLDKELYQSILVSDEEIDNAWGNADFGRTVNKRDLIHSSLINIYDKFVCGRTITCILLELGLIAKNSDKLKSDEYVLTVFGLKYIGVK